MAQLITINDSLEIKAGRSYVLGLDANVSAEIGERYLGILRGRFPGSEFALVAPGATISELHGEKGPEVFLPAEGHVVKGEPHAVRQNDLVAALKRVAAAFPPHTDTHHVLSLLARELLSPPDAPSTAFSAAPNPLGLGAVVRTDEGVFVRRIQNDNRDRVWWRVPDGEWYTDSEIGKPTEVLAPGVQL